MESLYDKSKLTKEQKKCLSLVESLGIYELRSLSRIFGGNSPTTQKRNDHIKVVMDKIIAKEEIEPFQRKTGRPYKEIDSIAGVLDELSHITGMDYTQKTFKQKKITFNQIDEEIFSQNLFPIQVKGIVLSNENNDLYLVNQYNNTLRSAFGTSPIAPVYSDNNIYDSPYINRNTLVASSYRPFRPWPSSWKHP